MNPIKSGRWRLIFIWIFFLIFNALISCVSNRNGIASDSNTIENTERNHDFTNPPIRYYVFQDNNFIELKPDIIPVMIGGKEKMYQSIYMHIRYPAYAREHGIQGKVYVTIIVNEIGRLEDAYVSKGVGGGCDEEALRVIRLMGQNGFEPALLNNIPVKVKYDMFINFVLQ